jgi:hypothetical protein
MRAREEVDEYSRRSEGLLNRAVNSLAFHSLAKKSRVIRRRRRRHGGRTRSYWNRVESKVSPGLHVDEEKGGWKSDQFISAH